MQKRRTSRACVRAVAAWIAALISQGCAQPKTSKPLPEPRSAGAAPLASPAPSASASASAPAALAELAPDHVRSQADCPENMLFVPAGRFVYRGRAFDRPASDRAEPREFHVAPFCIDRREVSVFLFEQCAACRATRPSSCRNAGDAQTCVTQPQAAKYCETAKGAPKRLPTPEEWLYAALGSDGRKLPWGNTWYPWGNDRADGRPDRRVTRKVFCDMTGPHEAERVFDTMECSLLAESLDVSPFGVENLGSNVLEWTSMSYLVEFPGFPGGLRRCVNLGLDHSGLIYSRPAEPSADALAVNHLLSCDDRDTPENSTSNQLGFRCATSKKAGAAP